MTIVGAAAHSEIAHHCKLRFMGAANRYDSVAFCFAAFMLDVRSFQNSTIHSGKSAKMAPTRRGPAFRNIGVAITTTKPLAIFRSLADPACL